MTTTGNSPAHPELPAPVVRPPRRGRVSLIWLVPLIAAATGGALVVRTYLRAGPYIKIVFETAEGLEAGKTEVKYKNVVVGRVRNIVLSGDRKTIVAGVDLTRNAASLAVEDTRFWVERPRFGLSGISGIGTLLSGAFIGVDIGRSTVRRLRFLGQEKPPAVTRDQRGRRFTLRSGDSGSLSIGSPIYFRRIPVGSVASAELSGDGKGVAFTIFVDAPYDGFVTSNTRFWNASGVDLAINSQGLKLNTQSLATVIAGGIAFETPEGPAGTPVKETNEFRLYSDRAQAFAPPDEAAVAAQMRFFQSTRGLSVGAPVDFQGISLGTVRAIALDYNPDTKTFHADVSADLYPARLGPAYATLLAVAERQGRDTSGILQDLVKLGLRAQIRMGNILIGQAYVALDFFKEAKLPPYPENLGGLRIPTEPGSFDQLQQQLLEIVRKLGKVPFDEIGTSLARTLKGTDKLMARLDKDLAPEAKKLFTEAQKAIRSLNENVTSPDAPLQQSARATMEQVKRAAYSLRALADYLERHPESLIRGKPTADPPGKSTSTNRPR